MCKRLFITASGQNVGKTTSTLGLYSVLKNKGYNVGYCKPVGQKSLSLANGILANKDAVLFAEMMGFELEPAIHSPITIPKEFTKAYLENPSAYPLKENLIRAANQLHQQHDIVIYEGSGHPGVGSVLDLSGADIAKIVGASVILIVEGGIGSTLDRINLNLALFREQQIPIKGIIVNKVKPHKIEQIRHYLNLKLSKMNIPLLGILPYEESLSKPILETIRKAVEGKVLFHPNKLDVVIYDVVSGALIEKKEYPSLKNLLLAVNFRRLNSALESIIDISKKNNITGSPLSGILIHGKGDFIKNFLKDFTFQSYIDKYQIPVIATSLDTYGSATRINNIEVKINSRTPWKAAKAFDLVSQYIPVNENFLLF